MSRIWAVARHMIAEGIRMKSALVFIVIILILLPVIPLTVEGDGVTLKSRAQSLLSYSLGSVGFLLSLLTVFLSCGSLSNEIRQKHIILVASKPIPRWQFFLGKWLGISTLNAVLLVVTGLSVWGFTQFYLKTRPTFEADRKALEGEVLTVRYGAKMEKPDLEGLVQDRLRKLREEGRLDNTGFSGQEDIRKQIREDFEKAWRTIGPGQVRDFAFRNLLVNRDEPGEIYLRFKPTSATGLDYLVFRAMWQCGDREDVDTLTNVQQEDFIVGRFHSIPVPNRAVNKEGTLYVRMQNIDPHDSILFEGDDSFEVLYDIGTFHWNLFRALSIIWCRLAFLAALGLALSTFLSFPVACMVALLVMLVATGSGFLTEAIKEANVGYSGKDPMWIIGPLIRPLASFFVWLVPDFSKFDPVGTVVAGRVVPLIWVMQSLATLVFIKGLILGVLGCVIFTKRELAQVVA